MGMGSGKGLSEPKPKLAGINEIDVATNETNVPPSYFAGARKLNVSWIMVPLVTRIITSDQGGKK